MQIIKDLWKMALSLIGATCNTILHIAHGVTSSPFSHISCSFFSLALIGSSKLQLKRLILLCIVIESILNEFDFC